jgi:phosphoglucomutase/phosphomannomutase
MTPQSVPPTDVSGRLDAIAVAHAAGTITEHSARTMRDWLTQPRYAEFAAELAARIDAARADAGRWKELDDAYWTVIPFGTGGRRGRMYPVGSNAINDRTIGESAQGLADYVRSVQSGGGQPSCAIAYDTRHRSEHFARLCAEVLLAAGFRIFFLRGFRSTPELSFAVRHTRSDCGIMVTASHNPPSDNAVKVYWAGGVQVLPPHDKGIIDRVMQCDAVHRESFDAAVTAGRVRFVEQEIDPAFVAAVLEQQTPGPRDVSILYTPLHGVGATAVVPVLRGAGFSARRNSPTGTFRTCRATSPIPRTRRCSPDRSTRPGRAATTSCSPATPTATGSAPPRRSRPPPARRGRRSRATRSPHCWSTGFSPAAGPAARSRRPTTWSRRS